MGLRELVRKTVGDDVSDGLVLAGWGCRRWNQIHSSTAAPSVQIVLTKHRKHGPECWWDLLRGRLASGAERKISDVRLEEREMSPASFISCVLPSISVSAQC